MSVSFSPRKRRSVRATKFSDDFNSNLDPIKKSNSTLSDSNSVKEKKPYPINRAISQQKLPKIEQSKEPKTIDEWFTSLDFFQLTKNAHAKKSIINFKLSFGKQFSKFSPKKETKHKNVYEMSQSRKYKLLGTITPIVSSLEEFIQHIYFLPITHDVNCLNSTVIAADKIQEHIKRASTIVAHSVSETVIIEICSTTNERIDNFVSVGTADKSTVDGLRNQRPAFISHVITTLQRQIHNQILHVRSFGIQLIGTIVHTDILSFNATIQSLLTLIEDIINMLNTIRELVDLQKQKADSTSKELIDIHTEEDVNIWNEDISLEKPEGTGTLNSLVTNLTSTTKYENNYTKSFIMTYQAFTKPWNLLHKLKQRFIDIPEDIPDTERNQIELRVCIVLKYWIETRVFDFDAQVLEDLQSFLKGPVSNKNREMAVRLLGTLKKNVTLYKTSYDSPTLKPLSFSIIQKYIHYEITQSSLLNDFTSATIAEQISLMDCEMLKKIEMVGFLNQSWSKSSLKYRALSLIFFVERLDKYSFWISTLILSFERKDERVDILEKLLDIAQELLEVQNNFHAVAGFVVGFNLAAVSRLKHTFNDISKKHKNILENLNTFMNPHSSYATYRKTLATKTLPVIPFIGVYLSDLTFIDEGNPNMIDKFINYAKNDMVYNAIREVLVFQQSNYTGKPNLLLQNYFCALPSLNEKVLYELSLKYEPRGADPSTII